MTTEVANYTMHCSKEVLDAFVELFERNDIRNRAGRRLHLHLEFFGHDGRVVSFVVQSTD